MRWHPALSNALTSTPWAPLLDRPRTEVLLNMIVSNPDMLSPGICLQPATPNLLEILDRLRIQCILTLTVVFLWTARRYMVNGVRTSFALRLV